MKKLLLFLTLACSTQAHAVEINLDAIAQIESSGNPGAHNKRSDCRGLYQIHPRGALTDWNTYHPGETYTPDQLFDPQVNTRIADWYLHSRIPAMLTHYRLPITTQSVLWAYNAGIGRVKAGIMPTETKNYIIKYERITK